MYESELERAHGQMLEEMQSLEEDKNRAIEEAFARAQVEMKAVHENLAGEPAAGPWLAPCRSLSPYPPHTLRVLIGVRTNLLTLQPALRTLTNDYNGLKRQVRGFPLLLQEALRSVKAEVSAGHGAWGWERPWSPGQMQHPPRALFQNTDKASQTTAPPRPAPPTNTATVRACFKNRLSGARIWAFVFL